MSISDKLEAFIFGNNQKRIAELESEKVALKQRIIIRDERIAELEAIIRDREHAIYLLESKKE